MISQDKWNDFVSTAPGGSFLQSWEWGQMQEKLGVPYWRLIEGSESNVQAVALAVNRPLPWGKSWTYIPRGPLWENSPTSAPVGATVGRLTQEAGLPAEALAKAGGEILRQIIDRAKQERAVFIRIEPHTMPGKEWQKAANDVQPRHTLVLDLKKTEEELLGEMHQKTRYNIKLAGKKGVTVRFSTDLTDLDHFLRLSTDVHERSAFNYHPEAYYRAMGAALSPAGAFEIAIAKHENDVLAVHLLVYFGDTVTYVHGASSSAKRDFMAPHLLQWESIKRAKERGYKKYDFFGVAPEAVSPPAGGGDRGGGSKHPWAGITRFKEGFGGRRVSYLGAYDYVLDPLWYWTYSTSRRARSLWR